MGKIVHLSKWRLSVWKVAIDKSIPPLPLVSTKRNRHEKLRHHVYYYRDMLILKIGLWWARPQVLGWLLKNKQPRLDMRKDRMKTFSFYFDIDMPIWVSKTRGTDHDQRIYYVHWPSREGRPVREGQWTSSFSLWAISQAIVTTQKGMNWVWPSERKAWLLGCGHVPRLQH